MKKLILISIIALSTIWFGCNKNSNKALGPTEAYCIYENVTPTKKVFLECKENKTDAQNRVVQLRNEGKDVESVKKSTCSDC